MKRSVAVLLAIGCLSMLLAACSTGKSSVRIGWMGFGKPGETSFSYTTFTGEERFTFEATAGDTITLDYQASVAKGALQFRIEGPQEESLWQVDLSEDRQESAQIPVSQSGKHRLIIEGSNTGGSYAATWSIATPTPEISYQSFTLPAPEPVTFELPEGWDVWGNGGALSPDQGRTLAGLRMAWVKPGQDAERFLFNEDAVILETKTLTVAGIEMHRYTVEAYLTIAATGERKLQGYELVYAFPAANPEQVAGVFVAAPSQDELAPLAPVAKHMAASLKWEKP